MSDFPVLPEPVHDNVRLAVETVDEMLKLQSLESRHPVDRQVAEGKRKALLRVRALVLNAPGLYDHLVALASTVERVLEETPVMDGVSRNRLQIQLALARQAIEEVGKEAQTNTH